MRRIAWLLLAAAFALCAMPAHAMVNVRVLATIAPGCSDGPETAAPNGSFVRIGSDTNTFSTQGRTLFRIPPGQYKIFAGSIYQPKVRLKAAGASTEQDVASRQWGPDPEGITVTFTAEDNFLRLWLDYCGAPSPCGPSQAEATREFRENLLPVLRHPRCANCHGALDIFSKSTSHPGDSFADQEEDLQSSGWAACAGCHDAAPKDPKAPEELQWRAVLTNAARWGQASEKGLCVALKASAQTGGELISHVQDDVRVGLGFAGKRGHGELAPLPPPRTKAQFTDSLRLWADAMGGEESWGNADCGCEGLSDNLPAQPAKPSSDCDAAVSRVQKAVTDESYAFANARQTACQFASLPPESRAGRPQAINDIAQNNFDKARQETAAATAAATGCDTSGVKKPEVFLEARSIDEYLSCAIKADLEHTGYLPIDPRYAAEEAEYAAANAICERLLEQLDCEQIRVKGQDEPPVMEDPVITVPDDVKPECRDAYRALRAVEIELERAQKYLVEIGRTYSGAGPKGFEIYKSAVASRDRASEERYRAQTKLDACEQESPGQGEPRTSGAPVPMLPPGDTPQDWEPDTNRAGPDLEIIELQDADPTACIAECQDYGGCTAFTYVKPGAAGNRAPLCKLKSAIGPATRDECCISGLP